jgi:hypothetical protein
VRKGFRMQNDMSKAIFQSTPLKGLFVKDGAWHGPNNLTLALYPSAGYTVYGKGTDQLVSFVATGVYLPGTLRMAFDKRYQSEAGGLGQTMTVQMEWKRNTQLFKRKYHLTGNKQREEEKYMIQKANRGERQ